MTLFFYERSEMGMFCVRLAEADEPFFVSLDPQEAWAKLVKEADHYRALHAINFKSPLYRALDRAMVRGKLDRTRTRAP